MVSLTLNKQRLFSDLGVPESKELLHKIVMMGAEIDDETATELVVNITPNRPDLLSQQGFTRGIAAFLGLKPGLRTYTTTPSKLKVTVDESVRAVRPYTACAVARNLRIDEERLKEIIDIQERLHVTFCRKRKRAAIGVYPMEAISGNITYTALEPSKIRFRPLEAEAEMTGAQILEQHPKGREYAHLLSGLPRYAVFMDGKKRILSMPPVINSHDTGKVTAETKEVFIECSGFDFTVCHQAVQMICAALADMGASIHTVEVNYGRKVEITPDMATKRQEFYGYYVNRRLGIDLKKEDFAPLLAKMGLGFEEGRIRETYYALLPPYRTDFLHQIDVVEDVAIAYGYENIHAEPPKVATIGGESPRSLFERIVRGTLVGYGLLEAKNYHLLGKDFQMTVEGIAESDLVILKNSASDEYNTMRHSLLSGMLQMLSHNKVHEYPQRFFEIGAVFEPAPDHVEEPQHVGITLAGDADYTRIRQLVDGLLASLGLVGAYTAVEDPRFMKGRCAQVAVDGVRIGVLGELSPRVLSHAQLPVPVAATELDVDAVRMIVLRKT